MKFFADNTIIFCILSKRIYQNKQTKNPLELVSDYNKVAGYKFDIKVNSFSMYQQLANIV